MDTYAGPRLEDAEGGASPLHSVLLVVLPALILFPSIFFPYDVDQGVYAQVAKTLLNGSALYRDVFAEKGPLLYFTYALGFLLFGTSELAVRLVYWLILSAACALCGALARRLSGRRAALVAAAATALAILTLPRGVFLGIGNAYTAEGEDGAVLFSLLALYLATPREQIRELGLLRRIGAGVAIGLACLYKPTYVVSSLFLLAAAAYRLRREGLSWGRILLWLAGPVAGTGAAGLAFAGYLMAAGAFTPFWDMVVVFNAETLSRIALRSRWHVFDILVHWAFVRYTALGLVGIYLLRKSKNSLLYLLIALNLGNLVSAAWQGRFVFQHWQLTLAVLSPFLAAAVLFLLERLPPMGRLPRAAVIGGILVAACSNSPLSYLKGWAMLARVPADTAALERYRAACMEDIIGRAALLDTVEYIHQHTPDGAGILAWGYNPIVLALSDRRPAIRFGYNLPLVAEGSNRKKWQEEVMEAVTHDAPAAIVTWEQDMNWEGIDVSEVDDMRLALLNSTAQLARFPALQHFVNSEYAAPVEIGVFRIFLKKGMLGPERK